MPTITGGQIILNALGELNIVMPSDTLAAFEAATPGGTADILQRLQWMMTQWANETLTIPLQQRYVFPLLANKGGPADPTTGQTPYTIGVGGDLNIPRPTFQQSVVGAGLLLAASNPVPVEIPRGVMTNDEFEANRIKNLTSTLFTYVFYRPEYQGDLGALFLWPVPTDLTNSLVLYIEPAIAIIADTTTTYSVPPGYEEALAKNLAVKIGRPYGRPADADLKSDAAIALGTIKRANMKLSDLPNDFQGIGGSRGGRFNILTGEGG